LRICFIVVAAELGAEEAAIEYADLDAGIKTAQRVCQDVRSLMVKAHSTLERVRDVSIPESTSIMMASIIEALTPKEDSEDPLVAAVRCKVTIGSESVFSMLMMHAVKYDFEKIMGTYPKGKDGRDKSPKDYLERARDLANHLALFLAERNARRKAAREQKRTGKGASSGRATGSSV
jgi:hypothetical protein